MYSVAAIYILLLPTAIVGNQSGGPSPSTRHSCSRCSGQLKHFGCDISGSDEAI